MNLTFGPIYIILLLRNEAILMQTKAILFDKDGTLMDFGAFWLTVSEISIKEILEKLNITHISPEEILKLLGAENGVVDIDSVLCSGPYSFIVQEFYRLFGLNESIISAEKFSEIVMNTYARNFHKGIVRPACPNLLGIMTKLKSLNITLGIVTSDIPKETNKCLSSLGIADFFDYIYCDDGKTPTKPEPYCILDFCEKTGIAPDKIIMVGDSVSDMKFAKNGGVRAVGVALNEKNKKILSQYANTVIHDVSEILDIL